MRQRRDIEPETRVGHCCGCGEDNALFKIPGLPRYRCDPCFFRETGYHHHLAPPAPVQRIVLP